MAACGCLDNSVAVARARHGAAGSRGYLEVELHFKGGALALALGVDGQDGPVMEVEDVAHDVEAQARAPAALQLALAHLREHAALTQLLELLLGEAHPRVDHREVHALPALVRMWCRPRVDLNHASRVGELGGVRDAVGETLEQAPRVTHVEGPRHGRWHLTHLEADPLLRHEGHEGETRVPKQRVDGERALHKHHAAAVDALKVEEVGDDVLYERGAGAQRLEPRRHAPVAHGHLGAQVPQRLCHVAHGQQRRSEVVHDNSNEATASLLGGLRLGAAQVRLHLLLLEALPPPHLGARRDAKVEVSPCHAHLAHGAPKDDESADDEEHAVPHRGRPRLPCRQCRLRGDDDHA
mmetsp:Transcript_28891/g.77742  ORF Transcript_28891/g.77742 Transcript_28891/m.77742 type:complete len:352 (+) Transcript_28891:1062-2117(+)